jgi:hypothetical protein
MREPPFVGVSPEFSSPVKQRPPHAAMAKIEHIPSEKTSCGAH